MRITAAGAARRTPTEAQIEHDVPPRRLGEAVTAKDRASVQEWGPAVDAPTNDLPPRTLGMFPFTV